MGRARDGQAPQGVSVKWAWALAGRWLLPAGLALAVVVVGGTWWHGYQTGKDRERAAMSAALDQARQTQAILADELEAEKQRERIVYRDRIRTVYGEPDPSGCASVRVPPGVLDAIRGATGQSVDGTVREAGTDGRNE
jgi:hypothetical protein